MKTQDIKNMASAYMQVLEKAKMDKVNPKALEKDFDDREDKDINNDGKVDSSDEYLHNRRKAVKQAMKKEEVEELDELSKKTLGSYVKKAAGNMAGNAAVGAAQASSSMKQSSPDVKRNIKNRMTGIAKATDKLTKEEVEGIDEISRDTARSYIRKASAHKTTGETPKKDRSSGVELAGKKAYGIGGKAKVMAKEEVELDEAQGTAAKYAGKSGMLGGKYTSHDRMMDMKNFNAVRDKRAKQKDDAHMKQDPKHAKAGYAQHMVDTDKAKKKAAKRGVDASHLNWRHASGLKQESTQIDEALMDKIKSGVKKARLAVYGKTEKEKRADAASNLHKGASAFVKASHFSAHHRHVDAALNGPKKPGSGGVYSHLGHEAASNYHSSAADEHRGTPAGEHHEKASDHHFDAHDHLTKYQETGNVKHLKKAAYHSKQAVMHANMAKKSGGADSDSHETDRDTQSALHAHKKMNEEFANMSMKEKLQLQKESILEREMTDAEMKKREEIVKGMKKNKADLEKRYGSRWKDVMYATATKQAMESVDNALAMTKNLLTTKESFKTETTTWPVYARIKEANDRAKHYRGATPPETMDDKLTASDKAFLAPHGELKGNDSGIDGAKAAEYTAKNATTGIKPGGGMNRTGDQKTGDKNIIKSTEAK